MLSFFTTFLGHHGSGWLLCHFGPHPAVCLGVDGCAGGAGVTTSNVLDCTNVGEDEHTVHCKKNKTCFLVVVEHSGSSHLRCVTVDGIL